MQTAEISKTLGYENAPNFLRSGTPEFQSAPDYGHIFRRAAEGLPERKSCSLKGVYALRHPSSGSIVPVVYLCEAPSEEEAGKIHRRVWNQDVVPFLFVSTPQTVRLYSGFRYRRISENVEEGVIRVLKDLRTATDITDGFSADAIDSGRLWRQWGDKVAPAERVDWRLLKNLKTLDGWLQNENHGKLPKETSHALIGKYVYLHYLRDRGILSDKKFEKKLGIAPKEVFGRQATLKGTRHVVGYLDRWLNGSVFPLVKFDGKDGVAAHHLRWVAAAFAGDSLDDEGYRQLHLDFAAYDFSYIPIETLSVVYEQFLHGPSEERKASKARETGTYYTPIPVVNYILSELEQRRPLGKGTRVFDPSCGSGAFLVQSYRRLIEKEFASADRRPSPMELRELLQRHIFGVDSDADACSVTELSLILTLLDYVNPPDLEDRRSRFKLPKLRDRNIFCDDFFRENSPWRAALAKKKCGWIAGNPPWKKLNPAKLGKEDRLAWDWMTRNKTEMPVGGNQVAQAFAWGVGDFLVPDGEAGMLLPAMTLFDDPTRTFRKLFFRRMNVHAMANFSNLAEVLFAGRSRVPAAAFIYRVRDPKDAEVSADQQITVYSPLVANQEPTRPLDRGTRNEIWNLVVNAAEIRAIPAMEACAGDGLPWKLAAWGSHLDRRLLGKLGRRFSSFSDLENRGILAASEGLQLRKKADGAEAVEFVEEVVNKHVLDVDSLKKRRHIFVFPAEAIQNTVPRELANVRRRGGVSSPLSVCRPPHVIVSAARNFAVFSGEYLVVPSRQIGISSPTQDEPFLKALSLFLSSDFANYHQFWISPQLGVQRARATLRALRQIPVPLGNLTDNELKDWETLHSQLVKASQEAIEADEKADMPLFGTRKTRSPIPELLRELNKRVNDALELNARERALVHDLVNVRLELRDGMLGEPAIRPAKKPEILAYAKRLKADLDSFIEGSLPKSHQVAVVYDQERLSNSGMVVVNLTKDENAAQTVEVVESSETISARLTKARDWLRRKCSQWVYFDRNLRVYEGTRTYILKPMQRFHWTESQAMCDASAIIAETVEGSGDRS